MIRDPQTLLDYEAKRRPDLAALLADLDTLSEATIRATELPMQWMHEALLQRKTKRLYALAEAGADEWAIDSQVADPTGTTRRWTGIEAYIRVGRTELLMKPGQLIWLDRNGVWIDTIHTNYFDPKLWSQTQLTGRMSRSEYNLAVRARASACTVSSPTEPTRFRIYRPAIAETD